MYEKVKYVTTCRGQCLSPSSKLSEFWRKEETALFQQAWGQEIPDVGPSSSQEGELWIMKPFLALLLHNSNFACGDFTDKPFSLTWRQAPLSKFPLRFPSISSVLSISTSVRKCRAKELLLATCLDREKGISVIAPLGNPRKGYLSILFQALSMNTNKTYCHWLGQHAFCSLIPQKTTTNRQKQKGHVGSRRHLSCWRVRNYSQPTTTIVESPYVVPSVFPILLRGPSIPSALPLSVNTTSECLNWKASLLQHCTQLMQELKAEADRVYSWVCPLWW